MTLTEWTEQLCDALGLDLEVETDAILDLAATRRTRSSGRRRR